MKKFLIIAFFIFLIIFSNFVCYAGQDTDIPSDAALYNVELLQEGEFPNISVIEAEDEGVANNILQALYNKTTVIEVDYNKNEKDLIKLYENIINDTPMLYDVLGNVGIKKTDTNKYNLYPTYKPNNSDAVKLFSTSTSTSTTDAINDILAQVKDEMSDVEKILAVHDYILTHYEYDYSYSYYYMDEFLTHKRGVCNAYALTFQHIMDRIDIDCSVVVSEKMNHAWNVVYVDGNQYHIDLTWDDTPGDEFGRAEHSYFMLSNQAMGDAEHKHYGWSDSVDATDTKYDSYVWTDFKSPMQYYNGDWYTAQSGKIYKCSIQDNSKTELGVGDKIGIYEEIMYIIDSSYNLYTIPMDKTTDFKPLLNCRLKDMQSLEKLNGLMIEDGCLKYATADDIFYKLEYREEDGLSHAVHDDYYLYRYFYSIDLTELKDTYMLGDNITWSIDANGTVRINGTGDMYNSSEDTCIWGYCADSMKSVIIENGIISIGEYAFYDCTNIQSVTIGNDVKSIGNFAFSGCTGLTSVTIDNNIESIGNGAFTGCTGLISVTIGNNVENISDSAFYGCTGLTSITIPENVKSIGSGAFSDCAFLSQINWNAIDCADFDYGSLIFENAGQSGNGINVIFGDTVERIPAYLFDYSSWGDSRFPKITSLTIGENVKSIGGNAFYSCPFLKQINWNARCIPDYSGPFGEAGKNGDGINVIFGDTVERIPSYLFDSGGYCPKITSVTIGNNVKSIGASAFRNCSELTDITIGENVESIEDHAFDHCTSLTKINWNARDCTFDGYIFAKAGQNGDGISVTFGDMVERIPDSLFLSGGYSPKITSITIGNNVKSIGDSAFCDCTDLTKIIWNAKDCADFDYSSLIFENAGQSGNGISVIFSDTVERIPAYLLGDYSALSTPKIASITIGNNVKSIGDYAFYECNANISINIGNNIESIGDYAFCSCTGLTSVTTGNNIKSIDDGAFAGCTNLTSVTIGNNIESIGDSAFSGCTSLTNITIPENVKSIGHYVFRNCTGLTSITIGNNIESIGDSAFYGCTGLTSITIGENVKSIGDSAFYGCTGIAQINWNAIDCADFDCSNRIFEYAGQSENGINVIFGDTVERIPDYLFSNMNSPKITSITIGENVKSIGVDPFGDLTNLTKIIWNATSVSDFADNCSAFSYAGSSNDGLEVVFGENVETIPAYCFEYVHFKSITIGNNVGSIGKGAFISSTGFTSVIIPDSVKSIGDYAFSGCTDLTNLEIPYSVEIIGDHAFSSCTGLTKINWNATSVSDFTESSSVFFRAGNSNDELEVVFGESVKTIPAYCFDDVYIKSITIGENVESIGNKAFYYCYHIKELNWNAISVSDFTSSMFSKYHSGSTSANIESVVFGDNVKKIPAYCFQATYIKNIIMGKSIESVGNYAFSCYISNIYYNGAPDYWTNKMIGTNNNGLISANSNYFVYVTLIDKNGNEICKKMQNPDETLDISSMITLTDDCVMALYFDKARTMEFDINTPVNENITLYAVITNPNEAEIIGAKNVIFDGSGISKELIFMTDKSARYFVCTLKYPTGLILKQIKSEDYEIEKDIETIGSYNYLYLTCIYDGVGNIPTNVIHSPFELVFDISENVAANDILPIEILDDAILADDNGNSYTFSNVVNSEIKIDKILATNITVSGEDNIDSKAIYSASVMPKNATTKAVKWSVSDETVATISQNGQLTPLKTGSVTIKATAKDGSGVFGEKTVSVEVLATITSISANIGVWDREYTTTVNSYTLYVPLDTTSVRLTTVHNGKLTSPGKTYISNVAKPITLTNNETVLTLTYNCDGFSDNTYTITIIRFEGTKTTVSDDGNSFIINPINIDIGKNVILALYDGGKFVEMQSAVYTGELVPFTTTKAYTKAKVMVWDTLTNLKPVYDVEVVK